MNSYQIQSAVKTMRRFGIEPPDALLNLHAEALELEAWLAAEFDYKRAYQSWLDAEKQWNEQQWLLSHSFEHRAAKEGWLRMRELAPRLDGAANFETLSVGLQNRYAQFASGVIGYVAAEALHTALEGVDFIVENK